MITAIHGVVAAFALFFSFAGYGSLLRQIFRNLPRDTGFLSAAGMAFLCIAGGVLNYLSLANRAVCIAIVLLGLLAYGGHLLLNRKHNPGNNTERVRFTKPVIALLLLFVVLASILFFAAAFQTLNGHDDQQAYAVFPMKMLETGSMGIDPFNERRMHAALGGQSFLHALYLSIGNFQSINCLDLVTGRLVFLALLAGHLSRTSLPLIWSLLLLTIALMIPTGSMNISSTITGLALFYALFRGLGEDIDITALDKSAQAVLFGAALCSLKHSFIPVALMTIAVVQLFANNGEWKYRLLRLVTCFVLCGLLLLPWMLESYRSNGTLLFPLLGRGFHGTVYGISPDVAASLYNLRTFHYVLGKTLELVRSPEFLPSALLVIFVLIENPWKRARHSAALVILLTVWGFAMLFAPMSGGFRRYIYPYTCAGLFVLLIERIKATGARFEFNAAIVRTWMMIVAVVASYWSGSIEQAQAGYQQISLNYQKEINSLSGMEEARKIQSVVPEHATILAVHSRPVLFDFSRNPIYVVDHAGGSSPPPGLPIFGSADQIAEYLRSQQIRYLIYSYADEGGYGRTHYTYRLSVRGDFYANRVRRLAENNIRLRDRVAEMAQIYEVIADDGRQMIIDLQKEG